MPLDKTVYFRIESKMYKRFEEVAKKEKKTPAYLLRELVYFKVSKSTL